MFTMAEIRRQFSREYKLEAVRLITEGRRTPGEVARELGIRPDMLRRWKREAETLPAAVFPGHGNAVGAEEELRRLRRENEVLRQEREILKKATAFFAKELR